MPENFMCKVELNTNGIKYKSKHFVLTAASTLAGDSSFGSVIIDITLIRIDSTVWIGSHLSDAVSYPNLSSPGSCRMEMHTSPFL